MDMFYYLADRKALLFPEEERVICKVETGPALYSDIALRVAFADVSVTIPPYDLVRNLSKDMRKNFGAVVYFLFTR
jgi:hypothetical protein